MPQIAETYAFLPREAVTRFLMSCGECQKRMHISSAAQDCKGTNTHAASSRPEERAPCSLTFAQIGVSVSPQVYSRDLTRANEPNLAPPPQKTHPDEARQIKSVLLRFSGNMLKEFWAIITEHILCHVSRPRLLPPHLSLRCVGPSEDLTQENKRLLHRRKQ